MTRSPLRRQSKKARAHHHPEWAVEAGFIVQQKEGR
jgi:hypothetical protein